MAKDKEDKPASTRALAVSAFTVPVTAAWLLAAGGILSWGIPGQVLIDNAGKIVAALGGGVAFLTVVLSAVQDIVPLMRKQRLLYPKAKFAFPSYDAFSERLMTKAKLRKVPGIGGSAALARLRGDAEKQDTLWSSYYNTYASHPAVAAFSARHLAWRELLPVMLFLIAATFLIDAVSVVRWLIGCPAHPVLWALLLVACVILFAMSWLAGRRSNVALVIVVLERVRDEGERPRTEPKTAPVG